MFCLQLNSSSSCRALTTPRAQSIKTQEEEIMGLFRGLLLLSIIFQGVSDMFVVLLILPQRWMSLTITSTIVLHFQRATVCHMFPFPWVSSCFRLPVFVIFHCDCPSRTASPSRCFQVRVFLSFSVHCAASSLFSSQLLHLSPTLSASAFRSAWIQESTLNAWNCWCVRGKWFSLSSKTVWLSRRTETKPWWRVAGCNYADA